MRIRKAYSHSTKIPARALALREARDAMNETQAQFATRMGVNQATLSRWERVGPPKGGPALFLVQRVLDDIARVHVPSR